MITKIGNILKESIPDFENLEVIYTNHYLHDGYDKLHHTLMIRSCVYCYDGCPVDFDLDTLKVTRVLENELPLKVEFDKQTTFEQGVTYKFYITIKEEEDEING